MLDIYASVMLRKFLGGRSRYWAALTGVLTPEQEVQLGSTGSLFTESGMVVNRSPDLQQHDAKLLAALAADGRASLVDLATAAGRGPHISWSPTAVYTANLGGPQPRRPLLLGIDTMRFRIRYRDRAGVESFGRDEAEFLCILSSPP
ncbi:hypothetical protein [Catenulispora pinisilvae]|uniref:hypothetical protein n=1 Tax=Catenulispora pinisilvae TaxID=2705253 RepID=UPI0018920BFC|nr:hypothetical protein [Catenulispora pinisilvae]